MRARLGITVFVSLILSSIGLAQEPSPRYTTLTIEYAGETLGAVIPVVITTSQEEGGWYSQHVLRGVSGYMAEVQVAPQSVLNEITDLPLLKRALESAKPVEDEPKALQNARFSAGVGHDHVQIILEKQPSTKILRGIERIAAKYPSLRAGLHQLEYPLR
jgi:hypothetical protein